MAKALDDIRVLEVSMQNAVVNFSRIKVREYYDTRLNPTRSGIAVPRTTPGDIYRCKPGGPDAYVYIYCQPVRGHMWDARLIAIGHGEIAIGHEELIDDENWSNPVWRGEQKAEVDALVESWTTLHTKYEVMGVLGKGDIPCGAVLNAVDIHTHPRLKERGMITTMHHPVRGSFDMPGFPVQLKDSVVELKPAPLSDEHTVEVLHDLLGLDDDALDRLKREAIV